MTELNGCNQPNIKKYNIPFSELRTFARKRIKNPLFFSLSGSHSYGFPSTDSDFDVRGAHIASTTEIVSLFKPKQTIELAKNNAFEIELVSMEIEKFIGLMLKGNGNSFEQLYSPFNIISTKEYLGLKELGKDAITKRLYFHYKGMANHNYRNFILKNKRMVKKYLYVLRSLMTGIYALERREIQQNIVKLNEHFQIPEVEHLIEQKVKEKQETRQQENVERAIKELFAQLDEAYKTTKLPAEPKTENLNKFLVKIRKKNWN